MASRKDEKEHRRQERLAAEAAHESTSEKRRTLGLIVGGGLTLAAIAAIAIVALAGGGEGGGEKRQGLRIDDREGIAPPEIADADLERTVKASGCKLSHPREEGNLHLKSKRQKPKYKTNPPTSGDHDPVWTKDGAYLDFPQPRNSTHALEHGRINVQYSPKLPERARLQLKGLFDEDPTLILLYPNPRMPHEVAATAWTQLLTCEEFNSKVFDAIRAFKDEYRYQGPEQVPPGA